MGIGGGKASLLMQAVEQGLVKPVLGLCLTHDNGSHFSMGVGLPKGVGFEALLSILPAPMRPCAGHGQLTGCLLLHCMIHVQVSR